MEMVPVAALRQSVQKGSSSPTMINIGDVSRIVWGSWSPAHDDPATILDGRVLSVRFRVADTVPDKERGGDVGDR